MKVRKDQSSVTIEGLYEVRNAQLIHDGYSIALPHVDWGYLHGGSFNLDKVGTPTMFSSYGEVVEFWPTPDTEYEIRIYYQEHMKVV